MYENTFTWSKKINRDGDERGSRCFVDLRSNQNNAAKRTDREELAGREDGGTFSQKTWTLNVQT